jgi:alanine racemase
LAAHKTKQPQNVFLKMNSGMNRLGFTPSAYRGAWNRLSGLTQVEGITLMTHFANADGAVGIASQRAVFEAATAELPGERSLSNSAATLKFNEEAVAADWVRPGILLYGSSPDFPSHTLNDWGLQPTMTLRCELIATQDLKAGDSVGYGSAFTAPQAMRIGVAACGYADGYPRVAPTGTPVLVNGVRTRLVGRVSMDMVTVDLSSAPDARAGSEVTLWGCGPNGAVLPIDEVAHAAGTVGYELMCALAMRVPVQVI